MMRSIIEASMKFRFLLLIVAVGLIFLGVTQLSKMSTEALPEFSPPFIEIQTEALGLSAEEVESLITVPLEADLLNGVAWLESISSQSITGLSSILLVFEPGTDIIRARQMVQERLTQAHALPNVSQPPTMLQPLSSASRVMMVGLSSDSLSLIDMSVLARWDIKPKLMGVPGVANVAIWGQRERQLQVLVDPANLQAQGVSLQQVINTSGNALWVSPLSFLNASYPGTGGWIETPNQRLGIRHLLPIATPDDLAQVVIEDAAGLHLGDVAQIVEDHQPLIGDALIDDKPGLLLVIEKFPEASTREITQGVETAIANMAPGLSGLDFDTDLFQPAAYAESVRSNLGRVFLIGGVLAVLVLFAFLFSWRAGVIAVVTIPLSLLVALLVLYYRGATLNAMVVAGLLLALGAVVDDAVLGVENVKRRLQQVRAEGGDIPIAKVILDATLEVRRPMLFATLILIVAVVPLYVLEGLAGSFFGPLATSYALAVAAALLVALTVTPALSLILFAKTPESLVADAPDLRTSRLATWLQNGIGKGAAERPLPVFALGAGLLVASLFLIPQLRQGPLLPAFQEPNLLIRWNGEPGTSLDAMRETAIEATAELRALPGVDNVVAHVGRAITSDEISDVHSGEIWVGLEEDANYDATVAAVAAVVGTYPDLSGGVQTYLQEVTDAAKPPPDNTLTVRVFGDDLDALKTKAAEVSATVAGVNGVSGAEVKALIEKPNLEIQVDLERAEASGLKPGDVRRAAATLLSGVQVGSLFEDQKVFDVVVWGAPEIRADIDSVRNLLIDAPTGGQVRLSEVADVEVVPTFDTVLRQDVSRYLDVVATVGERNIRAVARDVEAAIAGVSFPIEFHAEVLGDYAERLAVRRNFLGFVLAAVAGIFLLLQAVFRSWRSATAAFTSLLVALTGGVIVAGLFGGATLGVVAGLLAVFALAARNVVTLISHYQFLQLQQRRAFSAEMAMTGTRDKLLPVLTTAAATAALTAPILFFGSVAGLEVLQPMARVVLGGIVTTVLVDLFVVPALYLAVKAEPEHEFDFELAEAWSGTGGRTASASD